MRLNRFKNRRQVASYTGLCPGEHSSGQGSVQGSVTKRGNPRLRACLVELAWRLVRFQPTYPPVKKRLGILSKGARATEVAAGNRRGRWVGEQVRNARKPSSRLRAARPSTYGACIPGSAPPNSSASPCERSPLAPSIHRLARVSVRGELSSPADR